MILSIFLFLVFACSYFATFLVQRYATKHNIVDDPKSAPGRKQQKKPVPLLGGLGFTLTALLSILILYGISLSPLRYIVSTDGVLNQAVLEISTVGFKLFWVLVSIVILSVVGYLDDKLHLSAKWQILSISVYVLVSLVGANLVIDNLSYPFNSLIPDLFWLKFILSFIWVFLCVNATKILDGLDGLVALVGFSGFLLVASVSFLPNVNQVLPAVLALIWSASILGFMPFNFPNAKLYLGEGGSEIVGFLLAIFSLWSGAKVATVSMGIGLFILDIVLVVILRLKQKRSPLSGDRFHWHHRLIDLGLSKIQVLAITAIFLVIFGAVGLAFDTSYKVILILLEIIVLLALLVWGTYAKSE